MAAASVRPATSANSRRIRAGGRLFGKYPSLAVAVGTGLFQKGRQRYAVFLAGDLDQPQLRQPQDLRFGPAGLKLPGQRFQKPRFAASVLHIDEIDR